MKKILFFSLALLTVGLSSCLKDKPNNDFSHLGTFTEFVNSGLVATSFSADAATSDTTSFTYLINVDSPNVPTTANTVTIGADNTLVGTINGVTYVAMPTSAYKLSATTITIPSGSRVGTVTVTVYKNQLDPSQSFMLPLKILTTTAGSVSGNYGVHYIHVIGNDFAGTYTHLYRRWNATDSTSVAPAQNITETVKLSPVSPTQFEMSSDYYTGERYEVTFTKTGNGATATYSNFKVALNADDVAYALTYSATSPVTLNAPTAKFLDPNATYTYAQVLQRLYFQYTAATTSGTRYVVDKYTK